MDRYVLVVIFNVEPNKPNSFNGIETARKIHDKLKENSNSASTSGISPLPACSVSGSPGSQKWYFAIQALCVPTQYCSSEWEEVCVRRSDSEEPVVSAVDTCASTLQDQDDSQQCETPAHAELFEEAAEALHQLADQLPPPGRFLLDVIMLCVDEVGLKDFLPVIGSLKHIQAWHSARMTIVTEHSAGWQMAASYLSGQICSPSAVDDCIDEHELWRGGLLIREKRFVSELLFEGFSLKAQASADWSRELFLGSETCCYTDHMAQTETFHYYQPALELIQLVRVTDLPLLLHSHSQVLLTLSSRSAKAQVLASKLCALRGEVGALFCLSCVVSTEAFPPATQLSSTKWRAFVAKRPAVLSAPEVELKGEKGHYLLLVQGAETGGLHARLIHSASQINGAAALEILNSLILTREKVPSSSGSRTAAWLSSLPRLRGDQLLQRERRLTSVQARVLQECLRRRAKAQTPGALPPSDLRVLLSQAREQYLRMRGGSPPQDPAHTPLEKKNHASVTTTDHKPAPPSERPERSVLRNHANLQKGRQRNRSGLFAANPVECLMGPKDSQTGSSTLLDAREVLRHFTPDGQPSGDLQPLPVLRGLATSESSESLGSQGSTGSSGRPATTALRLQDGPSQSGAAPARRSGAGPEGARGPGRGHTAALNPTQDQTESRSQKHNRMLREVVVKTLKVHGIAPEHECFLPCRNRLFDVSKLYLKDLKTSRGLHEEMKKAAQRNAQQVIDWVVEKTSR
ncbi:mdm2-binding protein isoform X2 [Brachyhypopomus gauderio]|uniref:mdm2-binding protein isoform X2 n=1 Tax=Brachyhypopomus gauderio TaxID=698409 RepID=UPI004042002F